MKKALNREEMIAILVQDDIDSIIESYLKYNDLSFLSSILSGDGWIPYNQLTDKQLLENYYDRINYMEE